MEFWLRLIISMIMVLILLWKLFPTTAPKQKLLPSVVTEYFAANVRDALVLENHLILDLPFILSVRTVFRFYSLSLYGAYICFFVNPDLLGLTTEMLVFLIYANLFSLFYVFVFTQYVIWCCDTPPDNVIFSVIKLAFGCSVVFVAAQFGLNSIPGTPSVLPAGVKYYHQGLLQGPITVDNTDRAVFEIQKMFKEAGIFYPGCYTRDPHYPARYDAKAYFDACQAFKNGASHDVIVRILTRNNKSANIAEEINSHQTAWEKISAPIPKRKNMTESCADSDLRALKDAPDPTGSYFPGLARFIKK